MVAPVIAYFDYTVDSVTRVIMIYDRDGPRSVTNDAEAVIASLAAVGIRPDDYTIIYLDSEGVWDGGDDGGAAGSPGSSCSAHGRRNRHSFWRESELPGDAGRFRGRPGYPAIHAYPVLPMATTP